MNKNECERTGPFGAEFVDADGRCRIGGLQGCATFNSSQRWIHYGDWRYGQHDYRSYPIEGFGC